MTLSAKQKKAYAVTCVITGALALLAGMVALIWWRYSVQIDNACWSSSLYRYESTNCKETKELWNTTGLESLFLASIEGVTVWSVGCMLLLGLIYILAGEALGIDEYSSNVDRHDRFISLCKIVGGFCACMVSIVAFGHIIASEFS